MLTCKHVRELIHTLPLAEYSAGQLKAVERHAEGCSVCRPDLAEMKAIDTELRKLPDPSPPPGMAVAIMKRTTDLSGEADATEVVSVPHTVWPERDLRAAAAAFIGVLVVVCGYLYQYLSGELSFALGPLQTVPLGSLIFGSSLEPVALVLALGMLLLVGGLLTLPMEDSTGQS